VKFPDTILKILQWFVPERLLEEIEGDLRQRYARDIAKHRERRARRMLLWNAIRFIRPEIFMRKKITSPVTPGPLISSYFRQASRSLFRHKFLTIINVCGLALGMTVFFLIATYVAFEFSFDRFHANYENIVRITWSQNDGNTQRHSARNYIGIRQLLRDQFPEVIASSAIAPIPANSGFSFRVDDKMFLESGKFFRVDSNFFKVFPALLKQGDVNTILRDPHDLVISERIAKKIFGDQDPINRSIDDVADFSNDGPQFIVKGVMADLPVNSHFHADFMSPLEAGWDTVAYHWTTPEFHTYALLDGTTDQRRFITRLNKLFRELDTQSELTKNVVFHLQPLTDIHLHSDLENELETNGNAMTVYTLGFIAMLVLVVAWINYINLETSQFLSRVREAGVRKVVGASRTHMALQFMVRYVCVNAAALLIVIPIVWWIIPRFSFLTGVPINQIDFTGPVWLSSSAIFLAGSALVAVYPVTFLAHLKPAEGLKGIVAIPVHARRLRQSLVITQFAAGIVLVGIVMIVSGQLEFMRVFDKGIALHHVLTVENPVAYAEIEFNEKHKEFTAFRNKLLAGTAVTEVCGSSTIPGMDIGFELVNEMKKSEAEPYNPTPYKLLFIDYNYVQLFQVKLVAGRNYGDNEANTGKIILNESAVHDLGFNSPHEAIGSHVYFRIWDFMPPTSEIIGVIADHHHESIKQVIQPTIYFLNEDRFQQVYYTVRLNPEMSVADALSYVEDTWKQVFPNRPFQYFFLDEFYDRQFKTEIQYSRIFGVFAIIAIFIALLGITGIALFEARSRSKEISIRKVMGASWHHLLKLLSHGYIVIMLISGLIGGPVIYFGASQYLSFYPQRINVGPEYFLLPLAVVAVIIVVIVLWQLIDVSKTNPVKHLRNE
jgi:putative ABC transport system permease protein